MFDKIIVDCALKEDLDSTRTSHEGKQCNFLPSLTSKGICSTVNGQQTLDIWKPSELTSTFSQLFPNKHVGEVFGGTGRAQGIFLLNCFDIKKKNETTNSPLHESYKKILHNHFPNTIPYSCLGLQAWVSLNPNTNQLYQPIAIPYTIGVTRKNDYMDQSTTVFQVKPGHHTSIYVSPKVISSSSTFNSLSLKTRKCKLEDEIDGFSFITKVWTFKKLFL